MRSVVDFHAKARSLQLLNEKMRNYPPWFLVESDNVWSFNGLAKDMAVIYVSAGRSRKYDTDRSQEILLELQKLLGKTESQENDFRKLLAKLVPEDIKGVLMGTGNYCHGRLGSRLR